jgi:hypothetical protein
MLPAWLALKQESNEEVVSYPHTNYSLACVQMGAGSLWLDLFCAAAVASSSCIKTHDASFLPPSIIIKPI